MLDTSDLIVINERKSMTFMNRILLCLIVITRFSFGADDSYETQSLSSRLSYAELMTESSNVSEKAMSLFQGLGRTIYKQRYLILAASLIYTAVTELPTASDSLGINCTTMKPSMTLCQYGYFESARLTDVCQYGCNNYSGTLEDLAYGMLNNCCDYYGYFFDYY